MTEAATLSISDQIAINGRASSARAERDNKQFVRHVFKELEDLKSQNDQLKAMLTLLIEQTAPKAKKAAVEDTKAE